MKTNKTIALFGGSGGLGGKLKELLVKKYNVISLSSKDVDITNYDAVNNFFNKNEIDIVINLSGYNFDKFLHKITKDDLLEVNNLINVNVLGNINLLSCALPNMRNNNYGRIILISSVLVEKITNGTSIYSASKAFIDNLVKTASSENISKGISCNSLQLGYFDGGMAHRLPENFAEKIKSEIGLKRFGNIEELLNVIEFIIDTEYITGQNINISGGL